MFATWGFQDDKAVLMFCCCWALFAFLGQLIGNSSRHVSTQITWVVFVWENLKKYGHPRNWQHFVVKSQASCWLQSLMQMYKVVLSMQIYRWLDRKCMWSSPKSTVGKLGDFVLSYCIEYHPTQVQLHFKVLIIFILISDIFSTGSSSLTYWIKQTLGVSNDSTIWILVFVHLFNSYFPFVFWNAEADAGSIFDKYVKRWALSKQFLSFSSVHLFLGLCKEIN